MKDKKNNTWSAKLKRTLTSLSPVAKNRTGKCLNCGACCRLPNLCRFLKFKPNNESFCSIRSIRPLNCRKYPRTDAEFLTKDSCGYKFDQ